MPARLMALDEGPDILLDRTMVIVGRHPQCDARLESLRVSRHHCCMTQDQGEVIVRDLGSTNGIRINGQRVEFGRLRLGDELSIAHIRYRLESGTGHEATLADVSRNDGPVPSVLAASSRVDNSDVPSPIPSTPGENRLAAAVRELLPSGLADRCRIQVIVQVPDVTGDAAGENLDACRPDSSP